MKEEINELREEFKEEIKEIRDNHLFHINLRLGRVEGKLYVLAGIGIATFIAIWFQ